MILRDLGLACGKDSKMYYKSQIHLDGNFSPNSFRYSESIWGSQNTGWLRAKTDSNYYLTGSVDVKMSKKAAIIDNIFETNSSFSF